MKILVFGIECSDCSCESSFTVDIDQLVEPYELTCACGTSVGFLNVIK